VFCFVEVCLNPDPEQPRLPVTNSVNAIVFASIPPELKIVFAFFIIKDLKIKKLFINHLENRCNLFSND